MVTSTFQQHLSLSLADFYFLLVVGIGREEEEEKMPTVHVTSEEN